MVKTNIGSTNVVDGRAQKAYTIPSDITPGSHTIYATYAENDHFMESVGYNTAEIRISTTITVDNVIASIGETATFTAHVKYNTNQNVNEGTVQFQLGGTNIGSPVNVQNGVATLNYEIPSNPSSSITAIFIETSTYGSSTSTAGTLSIRGGINVVISNVSANLGSTATISATITDDNEDPVPSGQAQLYIDNTISGNPQTVTNGQVSFSYSVANNAVLGGHTIKVTYLQNDDYDSADGTATLVVRTPTTLTPVNVSGNKGQSIPVTIRVTDPNGSAITSGTVNISVGNASAVSATVGNSGEATITFEVPSNASDTIAFTAVYVENTNYQGGSTSTSGIITVRKGTVVVVDSVKAELGDEISLGATVTDENSELVEEGIVTYEIE